MDLAAFGHAKNGKIQLIFSIHKCPKERTSSWEAVCPGQAEPFPTVNRSQALHFILGPFIVVKLFSIAAPSPLMPGKGKPLGHNASRSRNMGQSVLSLNGEEGKWVHFLRGMECSEPHKLPHTGFFHSQDCRVSHRGKRPSSESEIQEIGF